MHCGLWEGLQQEDPGVGDASVLDSIIQVTLQINNVHLPQVWHVQQVRAKPAAGDGYL